MAQASQQRMQPEEETMMSEPRVWLLASACLLTACVEGIAPAPRYVSSERCGTCPAGSVCNDGACRELCQIDKQCAAPQVCEDGVCVEAPAADVLSESDVGIPDVQATNEGNPDPESNTTIPTPGPAAQVVAAPLMTNARSARYLLRGAFVEATGVSISGRYRLTSALE